MDGFAVVGRPYKHPVQAAIDAAAAERCYGPTDLQRVKTDAAMRCNQVDQLLAAADARTRVGTWAPAAFTRPIRPNDHGTLLSAKRIIDGWRELAKFAERR